MAFSVSTKFTAVDQFSATLTRMERGVASFANTATMSMRRVTSSVDKLNKKINNSVKGLTDLSGIAGAASGGLFIQTAVDATLELDKNISAAAAKLAAENSDFFDRNSEAFKALENKARELGGTTEFTAGQAAEALKNLATAGFSADGAMAGLGTTLNLATATQSELSLAADVAGKALSAFGLKSEDPKKLDTNLRRVSDTLNKVITTTGFGNLEELLTTLGMSGASANAAGVSIEQWGAIVGKTVSAGVDASSAGSQLAMMLTRLAKGHKLMNKLGITVKDKVTGNFRDVFDILRDVSKGVQGMGSVARTATLAEIFDVRAAKMLNILIDEGIDNVEELSETYKKAGGITDKMARFMRQGLSGMVASVGSAIQELGISISKTFDTEIKTAITNITGAAIASGKWVKENKELLKFSLKMAITVGKIVLAIKAFLLIVELATAVTTAYYFALGVAATFSAAASGNPFVWVAAAIAGIILIAVYWDKVNAKLDKFSNSPVFQLLKLIIPILMIIDLVRHLQKRWDGITKAFKSDGIIGGIKAIGRALLSFTLKPFEVIIAKIAEWTGSDFMSGIANDLKVKIRNLDASLGIEELPSNSTQSKNIEPSPIPLVSNTVTKEQLRTSREEHMQKMLLDINIKGNTDKITTESKGIPGDFIRMPSTVGGF